ncbi:hypothetical protein [Pseudomonas paracarnis]|uniref:hypothetical protein n=1 Tax=Pseudomonas paracarnis TaxID=2750625 RepID=UPI001C6F7597|nr:hypothetical protein [Pseudomonas paracarnis]MBW9247421.1 hypothetical protein [Pseudomonas paracarnis]
MTNQTIDGVLVSRELLGRMLDSALAFEHVDGDDLNELRALLDAPAKPVPACIGELERFESDGEDFVKVGDVIDMLGDMKAAKPLGEPVAWIKPDVAKTLTKDECCYAFGSQNPKGTLIPLYAEQPAPVAVPERLVMTDGLHTYEHVTGHNAAIDKMLGVKS